MSTVFGALILPVIMSSDMNKSLLAEQKITLFPGTHLDTAVRLIDITDYFVPVGEKLTLFNDDFIDHRLVMTNEDNKTRLLEIDLPANSSFSLEFAEPGKYYYSSKDYPKIQGSIRVHDSSNISIEKVTGLENDVDIQLSWTPSRVLSNATVYDSVGGNWGVDFIITFVDNKTGVNQEHIDYTYIILDDSGNELFNQGLHSTYGVENARYNFEKTGNFTSKVTITNILFAPVQPDVAIFDINIPDVLSKRG
jgi:hypothetical protein